MSLFLGAIARKTFFLFFFLYLFCWLFYWLVSFLLNAIFPLKCPHIPLLHGRIYSTFLILLSKRIACKTDNTAKKLKFLVAKWQISFCNPFHPNIGLIWVNQSKKVGFQRVDGSSWFSKGWWERWSSKGLMLECINKYPY